MKNGIRRVAIAGLAASLLLAGCDERESEHVMSKLKAFLNAIKPDALLLKGLTPGVTTEAQIRDQMGQPETERDAPDGSKRLEYPRGPQGTATYMVDIDAQGKLIAVTQVLTAANFAKVRVGMTQDEVRALLGKPGEVAVYRLKPETVWSWKWQEGGPSGDAFFNVHFDASGHVYTTSRSDIIRGH
ncbi:MAG: outer membrane protein assembly factor BamE domain-containing protein [Trinickia sp.]|jgi:outer membrane protein assembly factor BamE (lipoprotein component of BamABCDE complex)